jgi:hypothetical protein
MLTLPAEIREDGTLIANIPQALWGKKVKITIREKKIRQRYSDALSQWDALTKVFQETDGLDFPRRTSEEILDEIHALRESV